MTTPARLTPERENAIRKMGEFTKGFSGASDHVLELLAEIDALRAEVARLTEELATKSRHLHVEALEAEISRLFDLWEEAVGT